MDGGILLPQGTDLEFRPIFAFHDNTSSLTDFVLRAPVAVGHYYEWRHVRTPGPLGLAYPESPEPTNRSVRFEDVEIRMRHDSRDGYLGFYPAPDVTSRLIYHDPTLVEVSTETGVQSGEKVAPEETPYESRQGYYMHAGGPHLTFEGPGLFLYEGSGALKIMGPDLLVRSKEGEFAYPTGETPAAGAEPAGDPFADTALEPVQWTYQWLVLDFQDATIQIDATAPWAVAAPEIRAEWDGRVVFSAKEGEMTTGDARYVTTPSALARVDGRFLAHIAPVVSDGAMGARMDLRGQLVDSNLRREDKPLSTLVAAPASLVSWGLLVLGAVVGLGGSLTAGRWLLRRRSVGEEPPAQSFTVEECMQAANEAADEEDWPRVIVWLRRLRALAPTSARACADLAHALRQSGDPQGALDLYAEASRLSSDGEADFNGAVLSLELGRSLDEVEDWLERALRRTPTFVVDVEGDPTFQRLRGRSRFDRLVADAWTRTEDEPSGGSFPHGD